MKPQTAPSREIEFTFGNTAEIAVIGVDEVPPPSFPTIDIADLSSLPPKSEVTVMGILLKIGASKRIMSSKGKALNKRNIVLVDKTQTKLVCTLWGHNALDDLDPAQGKPLLVKHGKLSDYNGARSLSLNVGASMLIDPALEAARDLETWFNMGVDETALRALEAP
jgi:hypothetical protein